MNLRLALSMAIVVLATKPVAAQQPAILAPDASPGLLQERGAGEGPAWHPTLGLLTSVLLRRNNAKHAEASRPAG